MTLFIFENVKTKKINFLHQWFCDSWIRAAFIRW